GRPMLAHDLVDALLPAREDIEPEQHSPEAILLAHMVRSRAGAFLSANGHPAGIEQIAEEFPASGSLVHLDAELFRHPVGRRAGGHGAGDTGDAALVARRQMRV